MKGLKLAILGAFVCGIAGFNYISPKQSQQSNGVALSNVRALQAVAGEAWCDGTTSNTCVIRTPDGVLIQGVGQPRAEF